MSDYPLYDVPDCYSFAEYLRHIEKSYASSKAFIIDDEEYTYEYFISCVRSLIPVLSASKANAFVLSVENPLLFAVSFFAVVLIGKISILGSMEVALRTSDEYVVEELNEKAILRSVSFKPNELVDISPLLVENDGISVIAYSSGTTGFAKGVGLSQLNLLSDMVACMRYSEYKKGDIFFHIIPNHHLFGLVGDILIPLYSGGVICWSTNKLSFFENLRHYKPTMLNLPPVLVEAICKLLRSSVSFEKVTGGSLRKVTCGGAAINIDDCITMSEFGVKVITAYGLSECSPCVSISRDNYTKLGSSGKILPCCSVKIVNDEIFVSGQNVMEGYIADNKANEAVFFDGWLRTGDLGRVDEDGFIYITGRRNNLIVFEDGTKILLDEIESIISELDVVDECIVREVRINNRTCFNVEFVQSDSRFSIEKTKESIYKKLRNKELLPKVGKLISVDGPLPRSSLGKLIRRNEPHR